jgi:Zn-dependent peptidase ImmA (M78 family)
MKNNSVINIYGKPYKVIVQHDVTMEGKKYAGLSCFSTQEIQINDELSLKNKIRTLAHEVAHMAMEESGVSNMFTFEQKEFICEFCSSVHDIMQENKVILK